jgi:hypothetical protein
VDASRYQLICAIPRNVDNLVRGRIVTCDAVQTAPIDSHYVQFGGSEAGVLSPLQRAPEATGATTCSPMSEGKEHFAILDVESKARGWTIVFLPFKKKFLGVWAFGDDS